MAIPGPGTVMDTVAFANFLKSLVPASTTTTHGSRDQLTGSVIPALVRAVGEVAEVLRSSHEVSLVGTANAFGDDQLNVDVAAERVIRAACAACPSIRTASSEEDPVERPAVESAAAAAATTTTSPVEEKEEGEQYTIAFDPLDGSSIVASNFTVGAILGVWDGTTALRKKPSESLVAAVLGIFGPRTTAFVALRVPGAGEPACFEVGLNQKAGSGSSSSDEGPALTLVRPRVRYGAPPFKTRYFQPANLRATAESERYAALVARYMRERCTLRYTGGLVPDVAHGLAKGHGVYVSPVAGPGDAAKLRRLYELCPVALVVECAGGRALDPADGRRVLDRPVDDCDERGGLLCGTAEEVESAIEALLVG